MSNSRHFPRNFVLLQVTLLTLLSMPLRADVLNDINADTNNSGDWTAPAATTVFATVNVTSIATAEIFGAVLQESSTLFWTGAGAGANRALEYNAVSFDPSVNGAIVGIDYTVEHDRPASFNSHPFRVTLVQNGMFYSYFGAGEHRDNIANAIFTMFSNSSTLASDWHEVTGTSSNVPASNPDFSASGSPLTIALITRHGSSGAQSQGFRSQFRNFTVTFRTALDVDIKPGSDPNAVNPRSKGVIPVAVLGSVYFDASQIDPATVAFGPNGAPAAHNGHVEDVNDDGFSDMVVHFKTGDTGIACGDTEATLTGQTFGGVDITGTDSVKTTGCE
jgi:hypothetical protein